MKLKTNINPNYKTKKCIQFYENGYCPYGIRCQFLHKETENVNSDNNSANITLNHDAGNKESRSSSYGGFHSRFFYSPQTAFGGISKITKEITYQKIMESLLKNEDNYKENMGISEENSQVADEKNDKNEKNER